MSILALIEIVLRIILGSIVLGEKLTAWWARWRGRK